MGDTFGNKKVIALVGGKPVYGETIRDDLNSAIASLEAADKKRLVNVVRDHRPSDAEIDGSWGLWQSQVPEPPNVRINFFLWIQEGNYAQQLLSEDTVVPWEAIAKYDPVRKTYNLAIEGVAFEYNKTPISSLGNQHFGSPSLVFTFKDANTVFTSISYKAFNTNNTEIGNGGSATVPGDTLSVIQVNPAMAGTESTVVAKVIFEFTRLDGTKLPYEVKI